MKLKFLIPVFALLFILSCGDDPILPETDLDNEASDNSENIVPDDGNSENGNDSDSDTSTDGDKNDDNADSTYDSGDSKPDKDTDNADSEDDSENNVTDDNDTAADNDNDPNDTDSTDDSGDSQTDDDADSDTGDNDADTASGDDDADSGSNTGEEDELEVVLPYNEGKVKKTINFDTEIKKIDVLLMVDLSVISAAHDNLKDNVKTAIIDRILAEIPDSAFGLVTFGTIEQKNPYTLVQPITTDENDIGNAVKGIAKVTSGSTTYHNLALWEAATGEYNYEQIAYPNSIGNTAYDRSITIPAVDCSGEEGNIGGACFRENAMPIFVMASAKAFTDFSKTDYSWTNGGSKMKTKAKALEEMNNIHAKFIGFSLDGTSSSTKPTNDFKYFSDGTETTYLSGDNFNVIINADDSALSYQIAEAVKNLTANIKLDVKAEFKHVENDYGVENTVQFKKSFYPEDGDTVKAGDTVSFDVTFENKIYENTTCDPHIFYITVEAVGEGLVLDSRKIKVVVPGKEEGCGSAQ